MGKKAGRLYSDLRRTYQTTGDTDALQKARALLAEQQNLSIGDRERLFGYLEGGGRIILPEPKALLTDDAKVPGLDGEKMSKSYENTIRLREEPNVIEQKIKTMKTDPARVRRDDPGNPMSARCSRCIGSIPATRRARGRRKVVARPASAVSNAKGR
jgi:tryptophanyl-tRNA synthetase